MKNMPGTFSIDYACSQISPFETVIFIYNVSRPFLEIKSANIHRENIFLNKILKILLVFAQDVPYGMKAYVLWKRRLVNDLSVSAT